MSSPKLITPGGSASPKPSSKVAGDSRPVGKTVKAAAGKPTSTSTSRVAPAKADKSSKADELIKSSKTDKSAAGTKTAAATVAGAKAATPVAHKVASAATVIPAPTDDKAASALPRTPVRSGRPSARLAQITVPSMAQSVASSAAKSSYTTHPASAALIAAPHAAAIKKNPKLVDNWKTVAADRLSDEEVLAMPDSEYMNEKQTAFFRLKLTRLKADMLSNAGETTEHLREDTVVVPDPADRATIEEEHALELRTRDRERKLLKKIEQSIVRIDGGDYGYCDETGEPIGVGRLLARPTATLSLEAQQRRELKQKMFGD
ncbi:MAG: RNA polymerase-binding protein DksA [Burkholderiaceae bacterium]